MRAGSSGDEPPATSTPATTIDAADRSRATASALRTLNEAEALFHQFVVEHDELRDADPRGVTVAQIVERYWLQHGQHLAGADVQRRALRYCVEGLGDLTVAELTPQRQQVFVTRMRERGQGDPYIKRTLGALRAALGRAYRRGE